MHSDKYSNHFGCHFAPLTRGKRPMFKKQLDRRRWKGGSDLWLCETGGSATGLTRRGVCLSRGIMHSSICLLIVKKQRKKKKAIIHQVQLGAWESTVSGVSGWGGSFIFIPALLPRLYPTSRSDSYKRTENIKPLVSRRINVSGRQLAVSETKPL